MSVTTAAGVAPEDDILTTDVEPEAPILDARKARIAFLSLAGIAAAALLAAILVVVLAPDATVTLLVIALAVLALVVVAEIVLLLLGRPRKA